MHSGHITVIYALINVFHEGGEGGEKDENGMMARGGAFGSFSIFSLLAGRKIAS